MTDINSLAPFIREAFNIVNPGTDFLPNWHIDLIAEYLEAVTRGDIRRLIINIPPRSLKSTCVSVAWPAWLLGNNPTRRIICASYAQNLSNKLSFDCRHLMHSEAYTTMFPLTNISKKQNQKRKFLTSELGFRIATSVGGTITGEGGNFLILDDPHNAIDANSKIKRQHTINWFQQSFASRLDNKKNGRIVIVMQRLHVEDLTGFLLREQAKNWTLLNIPAISQEDTVYKVGAREYSFPKGALLHENREGEEELKMAKIELGSYAFAAQYLQTPFMSENAMIKKSWLKYYDTIMPLKDYENITQSWDTAIKSGDGNSYSVCTTWGKYQGNFYLLDVLKEKLEYPELKAQVVNLALKWDVDFILIEDKASGQSLIQDKDNIKN